MDLYRLLPKFWIQNEPTDDHWDKILNEALDHWGISEIKPHTVIIGPYEVWTSNWPYAFGSPYGDQEQDILPRVKTRIKLKNAVYRYKSNNS